MEILNNQLVDNDIIIADIKKVTALADIRVYSVPTEYADNGFFVSYDNTIPSCDEYELVFEDTIEPDVDTMLQGRQQYNTKLLKQYVIELLTNTCQSKDYDSVESICSYFDSDVIEYKNECIAFKKWRDLIWSHFYDVSSNSLPYYKLVELFEKDRPILTW